MILGLPPWAFWLMLTAVFIVIEAVTVNLVSIWFAIGSFCALIVSLFGVSVTAQIITAAALSAISLALILIFKPFDKMKHKKAQATNSDRVIGREALVLNEINPIKDQGTVKVLGQIWSAVSNDGKPINEGETVKVLSISGVKLTVKKI